MTLATMVVLMKDGEIVQQGSPLELYARPANRFAATFIGSPQINLMRGTLTPDAQGARFVGTGMDIVLPPSVLKSPIAAPIEVELGLRPESGSLARDTPHQTITVDYAEPTGADLFVNGRVDGQAVVARMDRALKVEPGDLVGIEWRLEDASVFATETGDRL
jgi:ABC-type sugar transport system ATPase subunit